MLNIKFIIYTFHKVYAREVPVDDLVHSIVISIPFLLSSRSSCRPFYRKSHPSTHPDKWHIGLDRLR